MPFQLFFVLLVLAVIGVIAVVSYLNSDKYKVRKALETTPRTAIRELREGATAKVLGKVVPLGAELLTAPLSGRACVCWEVIVEEQTGGKNKYWRERIHELRQRDFLLDDGTGVAHVIARDMKIVATSDSKQSSGFLRDASPALEAFLAAHDMSSQGLLFNKTLRYREGVFEPGEQVAVLGAVTLEDDPSRGPDGSGYRDVPKRPCLSAPAGGELLASDESRSTLE